jgi:hypothetical protein
VSCEFVVQVKRISISRRVDRVNFVDFLAGNIFVLFVDFICGQIFGAYKYIFLCGGHDLS